MALNEGNMQVNYVDEIREFVVNNFLFGDGENLKDDTSFLDEGIIDSTGILVVPSLEAFRDALDALLAPRNG